MTEDVLVTTWRALRQTAAARREATVRWAGPTFQARMPQQIVTTVIVPEQRNGRYRFDVLHEATRRMGALLESRRLVNLAQLHTHPGSNVEHSGWDDERAYSSRAGALSIVWPLYATALPRFSAWGIHERQDKGWVLLRGKQRGERIVVLSGLEDLRIGLVELEEDEDEDE